MTIELKVPFMVKDNAVAFQHYLSKNGCDSRLITETRMIREREYTATIRNFETFLDSVEMDDIPYDEVELVRIWVSSHKEDFRTFYANHEVGIAYSFDTEESLRVAGVIADDFTAGAIETDEGYEKSLDMLLKLTRMTATLRFLERNDCVEMDSENHTFTLIMKKKVDNLLLDFPGKDVFDCFDRDELSEYGIEENQYAEVKYQYMVVAGPKFILLNEDDLYDFLTTDGRADLMFFNNVFEDVQDRFDFYRRILEEIIAGDVQIDDLIAQLTIPGDNDFPYQVDAEYMEGVIADLKKLGLVTFKNGVANPTKTLLELDM